MTLFKYAPNSKLLVTAVATLTVMGLVKATAEAEVFPTQSTYTTLASPDRVAVGDFDGDGDQDLIVAENSDDQIEFFDNDAGVLSSQGAFPIEGLSAVAASDIDGDGQSDPFVAGADSSGPFIKYIPSTIGGFQEVRPPATAGDIIDLKVANADSTDAAPDLYWLEKDASSTDVSVYSALNDGSGLLSGTPTDSVALGIPSVSFAVGDIFATDGNTDIAVTGFDGDSSRLIIGKEGGVFRSGVQVIRTEKSVLAGEAGDLSGDGKPELLFSANGDDSLELVKLSDDDPPVFSTKLSASVDGDDSSAAQPTIPHIADLNGDGSNDAVVTNQGSKTVAVLAGDGNFGLELAESYSLSDTPNYSQLADIDGDGVDDLIVSLSGTNGFEVLSSYAEPPPAEETTTTDTSTATTPTGSIQTTTVPSTNTGSTASTTAPTAVAPELTVSLSLSKSLRAKAIKITVQSSRTASFKVAAKVKAGKKTLSLRSKQHTIKAGERYTFKFKLAGSKKTRVLKNLKTGGKPKITFTVTAAATDGLDAATYSAKRSSRIKRR